MSLLVIKSCNCVSVAFIFTCHSGYLKGKTPSIFYFVSSKSNLLLSVKSHIFVWQTAGQVGNNSKFNKVSSTELFSKVPIPNLGNWNLKVSFY